MSLAENPLTKTGEPITWNFKLLAQNDLGGALASLGKLLG